MPIGIYIDGSEDLTTFDCYGDVFFDELVEAMLVFFEEIHIKHTRKVFCDLRRVENLDLSTYQLNKLAELYISKNSGSKAAVLTPTNHLYHISKAFERKVPEEKRDFKIFQSADDSDRWLESGMAQ